VDFSLDRKKLRKIREFEILLVGKSSLFIDLSLVDLNMCKQRNKKTQFNEASFKVDCFFQRVDTAGVTNQGFATPWKLQTVIPR